MVPYHSEQNSKSVCLFEWLFSLNFRAKNKHVIWQKSDFFKISNFIGMIFCAKYLIKTDFSLP